MFRQIHHHVLLFLGFAFLAFSSLSSLLGHHGFSVKLTVFGFWSILAAVILAVIFQQRKKDVGENLQPKKQFHHPYWLIFLLIFLILFLYRGWFSLTPLASGDWPYFFLENFKTQPLIPQTWADLSLGTSTIQTIWSYPLFFLQRLFASLSNFSFSISEKIFFFLPFLAISVLNSYFLARTFKLNSIFFFFATLFYLSNTYILMLAAGGQVFFGLAVAFFPAVFAIFHQAAAEGTWFNRILAGVFLAILSVFDPRVTYLALLAIFLYYLFLLFASPRKRKNLLINYLKIFLAVLPFFLGLLAYWWLPLVLTRDLGLPAGFGSVSQTKELSFATMANTITTFQPLWPENIFGKLHPTPFYFFLLPIFVFATLLLRPKDKLILFFSLLSLAGIFLAKGAQEPLGEIYLFLNRFFPGFSFFRDPTKFYVLIVFSYSVLLAIFVQDVFLRIKRDYLRNVFFIVFVSFLVFLSKEAFLGQLGGTFQPKTIPVEYQNYAQKLSNDQSFYRTFWLPQRFVFAYQGNTHPSIDAWDFNQMAPLSSFITHFYHRFTYLDSPAAKQFFDVLGIRYLFVLDTQEQKFQNEKDRIGTQMAQEKLAESLSKEGWLTAVKFFNNAAGFENRNVSNHFWLIEKIIGISGSDRIYETLATFSQFKLKNLAFFEAEIIGDRADFLIIEDPKQGKIFKKPAILIYNLSLREKNLPKVFVPRDDIYQIFFRQVKGARPEFSQQEIPYGQIQSFLWQFEETRDFTQGENQIKIPNDHVDVVMLIPENLSEVFAKSRAGKVKYQKINSTQYKIRIPKGEAGKILAFSESFHPKWQTEINGVRIGALPLYNLINGFPITSETEREVVIEFLPQRLVPYGLTISIFSAIFVVLSLIVLRRQSQ